ncbi:MAG TPA: hypothetical protein PLG05_04405 [Bacteroidales bacterium]|nr:hypothetical protein [Bacteroidales bacterium]HPL04396.1 hypothetical protein [Bacteroidales bacterium]
MKKVEYIIELAKGKLSSQGYKYFVSLVNYYIKKYNWPKIILDEKVNTEEFWTDDEIISITHQLLLYVLEKGKLKNYQKIPENYIEYYFKTIIVSYVANKIKEQQNKIGLSFDDMKRIALEILKEFYFSKEIKGEIFWNIENDFSNLVIIDDVIKDMVDKLPKIPITEKTKHYKPRVKTALHDLFNLVNKPIKEEVILNQIFSLFDQSSFLISVDKDEESEIREDEIQKAIGQIYEQIDKKDIPVFLDYYFSTTQNSLNSIALKYNLPKSTVHHRVSQFTKIISASFIPTNEQEGVLFLENLYKLLDESK